MPWTSCPKCKGKEKILDPKQPAWEAIEIGPKYIGCPNRDCLNGKVYISKYTSNYQNQDTPPDQEMAAQKT
ncbi:MAG: hypothetical protein LUQ36_07415 [Methanoregula sp.]|jgi:hypothetical protein|nr:hypothetical protein [Methanoregula sp.]